MSNKVLQFWFEEITPKDWFKKDDDFDALIMERFGPLHARALRCELVDWRETAEGRLAEIIVLDQFSRNIYRDQPEAFAADPLALALAQEAVRCRTDKSLAVNRRAFLYMPFMHSESRLIHQQAAVLFNQPGLENNYQFELRHQEIIERFGRYPHRNAILGRESTTEELAFLQSPGSGF